MNETTKTILVAIAIIAALAVMMWLLAPRKRPVAPTGTQSSLTLGSFGWDHGPLRQCLRVDLPVPGPLHGCYRTSLPYSIKDPVP
jgi:hypothetical protein